ncbi:MAG: hypothetical protein ACI8QS_002499 [Planctomycetota bacterium]
MGVTGDITLADVLAAGRRRAGVLAFCVCLGLVAAAVFTLFARPSFKAEAKILLKSPDGVPSSLASLVGIPGLSALSGGSSVVAADIERILSRSFLRRVLAGPDATVENDDDLLTVLLDDDATSILAGLKRKLGFSEVGAAPTSAPTSGGLEAEVTRWDFPLNFEGLFRVTFLGEDRVRIGFNRFFDPQTIEFALVDGETLDFKGASFILRPGGDLTGRTFLLGGQTLRTAVENLMDVLHVEEIGRGTSVLGLTYYGPSPEYSTELVNRLLEEFIVSRQQHSEGETTRSITYLENEIERIGLDLAQAEEDALLWGMDTGPSALPESALALVEVLSSVELERTRATFTADSLAALLATIKNGELSDEDLLAIDASQVFEGSMVEPLSFLVAEREGLSAIYNDEWPALKAVRVQIQTRLEGVSYTLRGRIDEQRRAAADLALIAEDFEADLAKLPQAQLEFARHERSVMTLSQIQIFFRGQLEDANLRLAATTADAEVLDRAVIPLLRDRPSLRLNLAIGLILGLAFGSIVGFFLELKRPIVTVTRLAELAGAPVLASIKRRRFQRWLPSRDAPDGRAADDIRALRLSLLQRASEAGGCFSIAVTSTRRSEGRTRVVANLAFALVASGERVLLVDADTRRHQLAKGLGLKSEKSGEFGLGGNSPEISAQSAGVDELDLLTLGGDLSLADQVDAGQQEAFLAQAGKRWDRVLFDAPAVGDSADALAICRSADGVLLLARAGKVGEADVVETAAALRRVGARILGVVLNAS